jgi:hypothetical protein
MAPCAFDTPNAGGPASNDPNTLNATPYAYLIPCGNDSLLAPAFGDTNAVSTWTVYDQPYNLSATSFYTSQSTLNEQPWILRKHQVFRPVAPPPSSTAPSPPSSPTAAYTLRTVTDT